LLALGATNANNGAKFFKAVGLLRKATVRFSVSGLFLMCQLFFAIGCNYGQNEAIAIIHARLSSIALIAGYKKRESKKNLTRGLSR